MVLSPDKAQILIHRGTLVLIFGVVLALFPYTASASSDIKYLLLAVCAPIFMMIRTLTPNSALFTPNSLVALILYLFVLANIITALLSQYPLNGLYIASQWMVLAALFTTTAYAFRNPENAYTLMKTICLAVACSSIYGFCQKVGLDPFPWATRDAEEYWNSPATYGNPNIAAYTLVIAFILSLSLALRSGSHLYGVVAAIISVHIFFTGVRSGILALLLSLAVVCFILLLRRTRQPSAAIASLALLLTVGTGLAACGAVVALFYIRTGNLFPTDGSLILRYNASLGASKMIFDRPLFGFGPGTYLIENPPYWTAYEKLWFATKNMFNTHTHNDYLETAVESGVLGLSLYVSFLVALIVYSLYLGCAAQNKDSRRISITLAACFVAFATDGLFGFNVRAPVSAALLFILAGILEGLLLWSLPARPRLSQYSGAVTVRCAALFLSALAGIFAVCAFTSQVFLQKATAARYWGYPNVAHQFLDRARLFAPWNFVVSVESGEIALEQSLPDLALAEFERAAMLNPNWIPTHTGRARAYLLRASALPAGELRNKEIDQAKSQIETALSLCPDQPFAQELLGALWLMRAEVADAEEAHKARKAAVDCFGRAQQNVDKDSDRSRLWIKSATTLAVLGEPNDASHAFGAAVELDPTSDAGWHEYFDFANSNQYLDRFLVALSTAKTKLESERSTQNDALATICILLSRTRRIMQPNRPTDAEPGLSAVELAPYRLEAWSEFALSQPRNEWEKVIQLAAKTSEQSVITNAKPLPRPLVALVDLWRSHQADPIAEVQQVSRSCIEYAQTAGAARAQQDCAWVIDCSWAIARQKTTTSDIRARISSMLKGTANFIGRQDLSVQIDSTDAPNDQVFAPTQPIETVKKS